MPRKREKKDPSELFDRHYVRGADDECWLWMSARRGGFKRAAYGAFGNGYAHRFAMERRLGRKIHPGCEVDHVCNVPTCVNPAHLQEIDHRSNLLRSPNTIAGRNAKKTACPKGHPYEGANLMNTIDRGGVVRRCRACLKAKNTRNNERLRKAKGKG